MIELRAMIEEDLTSVARWLREPHVARWWMSDTTVEAEIEKYRGRLTDTSRVRMRTILEHSDRGTLPIGWCEWYPYDGDPEGAREVGAAPGECGIDYAIGDPGAVGRGLGTELIAMLVAEVRRIHPGCGVIVDPDAANVASRRVLERNGFSFVELRPWSDGGQMSTYRLASGEPLRAS
jgi:aminoglycoside 6'-N-acetyltransferase